MAGFVVARPAEEVVARGVGCTWPELTGHDLAVLNTYDVNEPAGFTVQDTPGSSGFSVRNADSTSDSDEWEAKQIRLGTPADAPSFGHKPGFIVIDPQSGFTLSEKPAQETMGTPAPLGFSGAPVPEATTHPDVHEPMHWSCAPPTTVWKRQAAPPARVRGVCPP